MPEYYAQKVLAYITHHDRLLVFKHTQHPEAGIQVPAGTLEPGEDLETAVLREAHEETGLEDLQVYAYLGNDNLQVSSDGDQHLLHRHFFHLNLTKDAPEYWRHFEEHPSDGSDSPIEFEFYWVSIPDQVPELSGDQGALLDRVVLP